MRKVSLHKPVLLEEVCKAFRLNNLAHSQGVRIIDATEGLGGHSIEFVKRSAIVLGIEADENALKIAQIRLSKACPLSHNHSVGEPYNLIHGNFNNLKQIAKNNDFVNVDGILYDLGISSFQLDDDARGFSFRQRESDLDLRISPTSQNVTGADLLNVLSYSQLINLFSVTLGLKDAKKLSRNIVSKRKQKSFHTVKDFTEVIKASIYTKRSLDISTLPFLALRIAVNSELHNLKESLPQAYELLRPGGRCIVISFHSGEDSLVKEYFRTLEKKKLIKILSKKPIVPTKLESERNPRAKSAKMRYYEKL